MRNSDAIGRQLVAYIKSHGHHAHLQSDGTICAFEVWVDSADGTPGGDWVYLPHNVRTVREWLGY
jgi:hypothetical protein